MEKLETIDSGYASLDALCELFDAEESANAPRACCPHLCDFMD